MLFHEMRVPLNTVILSMNDFENEDIQMSPSTKENVERINNGLNTIINIINDSLDFRKMSEGKMRIVESPFEYHQMIREVVHTMESGWKSKGVNFTLDLDSKIENIATKQLGDSNRLRQVIANFLSNAVKFTPNNGKITLRTVLEEMTKDYIWVYTHISDSGVGIRKEDQSKLFKPFVQIDPEKLQGGKGSGLGLSIVANIINSMNGTYGLQSEYGKGSTFWFRVKLGLTDIPKMTNIPKERNDPLLVPPYRQVYTF